MGLNLIIFILLGIPNPRADDYVTSAAADEFLECPANKNVEDMKYEGECFNNKAKKKIDSKNFILKHSVRKSFCGSNYVQRTCFLI